MKLLAMLVFGILLFSTSEEMDGKWIMDRHDSQRSGFSPSEGPDTALLLWKSRMKDADPAITPVATTTRITGGIICLDESGEEVWTLDEWAASAIVVDDMVVVGSGSDLYCLRLADGSIVWKTETTVASGSPLLTEDSVCFAPIRSDIIVIDPPWIGILSRLHELLLGCKKCQITCHDICTGEKSWTYHEDGYVESIAYDKGHFVVLLRDGRIYCLDRKTEKKLWQFRSEEKFEGYPALHGYQVLFSGEFHLYCLSGKTGHLLWKSPIQKGSSPAIAYGHVYVSSSDGYLYCIDEYTGELVWKVSTWQDSPQEYWKSFPVSSPIVADDKVFVGSSDGNFYSYGAEDGILLWKYTLGGAIVASPVIVDGTVLVPCTDGFLYAFGIDPETYVQKAQKYLEEKEYEKSRRYFFMARDWYIQKGDSEKRDFCSEAVRMLEGEIQRSASGVESARSAKELFDRGNEALMQKMYDNALEFFKQSEELYEKSGDKSGVEECHQRIACVLEKSRGEDFPDLTAVVVPILCTATLIIVLLYMRTRP